MDWPQCIEIGDREVGVGRPVFVIAEAGVNHNGQVRAALDLVRAAAAAGADAVKFQAFSADRLVTASAPAAGYQHAADQRSMLAQLELSPLELAQCKAECEEMGVTFLATPFSPRDVANLHGMGVTAIKIASPDVANPPLLRVAAETGLPILLSTGASTMDEVRAAVDTLGEAGCRGLVLLHCVSSYPTPQTACNLRAIRTLAGAFGCPIGYSDHTAESDTSALAVAAGACVLEKHFTLNRKLNGPDHFFSLDPAGLVDYVDAARRAEQVMGHGRREPDAVEMDVRSVARSSVVSVRPIGAGQKIARDMLTVKRPGGGVEPARLDDLIGRVARADIPPDTTIRWDMID
ncbi:MAG: N,N'-diacetyllegionaminic acid synthase [Phycisphaerae bacterium]|nr:N,N'-diacetyllegionaminic acid synthase [Phycisphaerae bacterium]